jgi:hypothetical protein
MLIIGGTRVPQLELACCRVGCDGVLMVVQLCRAALRLLSELAARVCRQLVRLHGMGNWHALVGDCSCERAGCRARQRLVVQGGDLSCEAETCWRSFLLVGDLSEKLPTSRKQDVLSVMILT